MRMFTLSGDLVDEALALLRRHELFGFCAALPETSEAYQLHATEHKLFKNDLSTHSPVSYAYCSNAGDPYMMCSRVARWLFVRKNK